MTAAARQEDIRAHRYDGEFTPAPQAGWPGPKAIAKTVLVCSTLALSAIGAGACGTSRSPGSIPSRPSVGSATDSVASSSTSTAGPPLQDADGDSDSPGSGHDNDGDEYLSYYGQAAGAADRRTLTVLLRRYYAVAAAGDGTRACSLLYWPVAESVVEEHEEGPPSLRGATCAQVASKLFARDHRELARQIASLEVTEVRLKGDQGLVRLRFAAPTEHLVPVHRDHGVWKVGMLLDEVGI
jgi:hypothetical protein